MLGLSSDPKLAEYGLRAERLLLLDCVKKWSIDHQVSMVLRIDYLLVQQVSRE